MGCHFFLQGMFPAQGSNSHHLHWQASSLPLSSQGSQRYMCIFIYKQTHVYRYTHTHKYIHIHIYMGFPGDSVVKNLPTNARDVKEAGSVSSSGRDPGGGHSNPLQYSCLENPMDRGAWWATVHRVSQSQT